MHHCWGNVVVQHVLSDHTHECHHPVPGLDLGNWRCAVTSQEGGSRTIDSGVSRLDTTSRQLMYHRIQVRACDWWVQSAIYPGQWNPRSCTRSLPCFGGGPFSDRWKWWIFRRRALIGYRLCSSENVTTRLSEDSEAETMVTFRFEGAPRLKDFPCLASCAIKGSGWSVAIIMLTDSQKEKGSCRESPVREKPRIEPGTDDLRERLENMHSFPPPQSIGLIDWFWLCC